MRQTLVRSHVSSGSCRHPSQLNSDPSSRTHARDAHTQTHTHAARSLAFEPVSTPRSLCAFQASSPGGRLQGPPCPRRELLAGGRDGTMASGENQSHHGLMKSHLPFQELPFPHLPLLYHHLLFPYTGFWRPGVQSCSSGDEPTTHQWLSPNPDECLLSGFPLYAKTLGNLLA